MNTRTQTLPLLAPPKDTRTQNPTPMSTSKRIESADLEIYEVTIGVSLLTGTSPTT
jgi:hypothetical protein